MVSKIDLSNCSKLETIDQNAFMAYVELQLPTSSSIKTLYGISNHISETDDGNGGKTKANISGSSNELEIPASVQSMYPIKNVDKITFEEGSQLRTLEDKPNIEVTSSQLHDLSNCEQLESVYVPINGKIKLPSGVYSIDFSKSKSVKNNPGTIQNSEGLS